MLSKNEKESLTLEEAQNLETLRALRNFYTGVICTIVDRKIPVNKSNSMIGDTLYELRKVEGGSDCPSFIISAPALFNLYQYALNEEGNRYCIAVFNYENELDQKLNKNEGEIKMKKIIITELEVGQRLSIVKDGDIKGVEVKAGDIVSVKKIYKDGMKISLYVMRKIGDKFVVDKQLLLTSIGTKLIEEFLSIDVEDGTEEKIEKSVLKQEVLDMKVDSDSVAITKKPKNIEIDIAKYGKFVKLLMAFRNQNATVVILKDGTKGVAKCDTSCDEYDEYIGVTLAYARAALKQENRKNKEFSKALSAEYRKLNKIKKDREFDHTELVKYIEKTIKTILESTKSAE